MKENLKFAAILYLLFNVLMVARGMDEARWTLSKPCKNKQMISRIAPGYILGCKLGEEKETE